MGGGSPALDQFHYRWYDDDNTDVDATTGLAAEDNTYEVPAADLGTSHHLRIKLGNSGAKVANAARTLQYNVDGAGWNTVTTTSSNVRMIAGQPTDADATAELLGTSARTFTAGEYDDADGSTTHNIQPGEDTEDVWSIEFRSADLSGGESIDFRVLYEGATTIMTYTVTPNATIATLPSPISGTTPLVFSNPGTLLGLGQLAGLVEI